MEGIVHPSGSTCLPALRRESAMATKSEGRLLKPQRVSLLSNRWNPYILQPSTILMCSILRSSSSISTVGARQRKSLIFRGILVEFLDEPSVCPGQELRGNIGTSAVSMTGRGGDSERRNASTAGFVLSGADFVPVWTERIRDVVLRWRLGSILYCISLSNGK